MLTPSVCGPHETDCTKAHDGSRSVRPAPSAGRARLSSRPDRPPGSQTNHAAVCGPTAAGTSMRTSCPSPRSSQHPVRTTGAAASVFQNSIQSESSGSGRAMSSLMRSAAGDWTVVRVAGAAPGEGGARRQPAAVREKPASGICGP